MTLHQLHRTPWRLVGAAATWHVTSQQRARRNALVASTALTASRRERMDVEDFLAEHAARFEGSQAPARPVSHIA